MIFCVSAGFQMLMSSKLVHIFNPEHSLVYQDMKQPLTHYYIASSHNTSVPHQQHVSSPAVPREGADASFYSAIVLSPYSNVLLVPALADVFQRVCVGPGVAPGGRWPSPAGGMRPSGLGHRWAYSYGQGGFLRVTSISSRTDVAPSPLAPPLSYIPQPMAMTWMDGRGFNLLDTKQYITGGHSKSGQN